MHDKYDILIVGAATTGVYLGWIMAKKGYTVLVIDKDTRNHIGERLEVIHFHKRTMEELRIPIPTEAPEKIVYHQGVFVSRLPLFLQRFYSVIEADGVNLEFSCEFIQLLFENQKICGAKLEKDGQSFDVKAKLVVDASGIASAVRTTLPENYGIETWKYDEHNRFFVILYYLRWLKPTEPHPDWHYVRPYYFLFIDPGYSHEEPIVGVAGPESFENTQQLFEETMAIEPFPPYEIKKKEYGYFAHARPPYSLVGDGFFCVGDSAAIMNPLEGRGIAETWRICKHAEEIIDTALKSGEYLTQEKLWEINVHHFRNEGAELAFSLMVTAAIYRLSENEVNLMLRDLLPIVNPPTDKPVNDEDDKPDLKITVGLVVKVLGLVLKKIFQGQISFKHLLQFLKITLQANKIKSHYKHFPSNPKDFTSWVQKAEKIWAKRVVVPRQFKTITAMYP